MTIEESTYISSVLQKLIDIPMTREIKIESKYCMMDYSTGKPYAKQCIVIDLDEIIWFPTDVKHPNWPKTVGAIKYIRDWGMDHIHGFEITFNNSYTKFRKQLYINQ